MPSPKPAPHILKIGGVACLLIAAGAALWSAWRSNAPAGEKGFFYDASAARIFTGPRTAAPPIRGVDGPEEDAFRAVIISTNGQPADRSSWHVAYLEKFSDELRQKTQAAQTAGQTLTMGRMEAQSHRFVRRVGDTQWHRMDSDEGEAILTEWARPAPSGHTPVICTP